MVLAAGVAFLLRPPHAQHTPES